MLLKEFSPSSDELKAKPWGFWVTLGLSAIVFALFSAIQLLSMIAVHYLIKASHRQLGLGVYARSLSSNGFFIAVTEIVSGLICAPLTLLFARLRKNILVKDYIGFRKPSRREWAKWLLILAVFLFLSDMVSLLLHQPIVPPFMADAYKTAVFLPALLLAIIIVAPIFEEILFRGFLFQGIRYSRLGPMGAIGITSFFWAIIHLQYDVYGVATVFAMGLLLGAVRLKTDSIYLVMVMHSLASLAATAETAVYVHSIVR